MGIKRRSPNGIVGVLIKTYWPGLVKIDDKEELALKWHHYEAKQDDDFGTKANAVLTRFWVSFFRSTQIV